MVVRTRDEEVLTHRMFAGERWRGTTVAHLLTHSAGQPAWRPWYLDAVDRDQVRREIASLPAEHEAGSVTLYSDLDFLVLWDVLEAAWGCPLEALSSDEVLLPLGMASACFLPGQQGLAHVCAPTELCAWRGRIIQGEVHDENAAALGGVAPHAGLFSSLADVEAFMSEILAAHAGRSGWMQQTTARRLTTRTGPSSSTFALGWATPVDGVGTRGGPLDLPHRLSGAGRLLSDTSFGHTGFTGTSVVADTTIDTWLAVLTNRVHPSRHGTGAPELRAALADLVATHRRA